ncbi:LysR family transcriptional regulator [Paraburkholderia sp.]|uniref:LysR family transcriptional regulator n=1 Tax=Paraburkholderia sp. TaxID=1926495 RepID=UPI00238EB69A|nr:LysR family transcriptional regulator [Paraburkholderia sp.]MDE1184749.1 LysR family transcriptional regulator [Paraburkholderia sp.]
MRFNKLDLNLLVALDALLDERKITRAAERLSLSQSAISGMLGRLREYFDDELLVQVGRTLELTPLALELVTPVRNVLLQIQTVVAINPGFDPSTARRHFKIATSDYVISIFLRKAIPLLERLAPNITIEFMPQVEDTAEKLRRGEYDFLIIPEPFLADDQPRVALFEDDYVCAVWDDNTSVGHSVSLEKYTQMGHVAVLLGWPRAPTYESRFLDANGLKRHVKVTTSDFGSVAPALVGTQLIATVHRRLANEFARRYPLRLIEPPLAIPKVRECLQWHEYRDKDPCHHWVRQLLIDTAARIDDDADNGVSRVRTCRTR